jgi:hypothetical protein
MTSIRERLRRLFAAQPSREPDPVHFSYVVHWTKEVCSWDQSRRSRISQRVRALVEAPGFTATHHERIYRLDDLDDLPHAGASMLALLEVLDAFADHAKGGSEDG